MTLSGLIARLQEINAQEGDGQRVTLEVVAMALCDNSGVIVLRTPTSWQITVQL